MSIVPNADQFSAYAQSDLAGEVVMLNLLKFSTESEPDTESTGVSGEDAYRRYGAAARQMFEARGGSLIWAGQPRHVFVGDSEANDWDAVALVSYPNRQAFLEMVASSDYQEVHAYREQGLERTVVIACVPAEDSAWSPTMNTGPGDL